MRRELSAYLRVMTSLIVRDTTVDDAEALSAVEQAIVRDGRGVVLALGQVRSPESQRRHIEETKHARAEGSPARSLVAELRGKVVGYADLRPFTPALCRHVATLTLGVHPSYQRQGAGRALMQALVEHARSTALERLELSVRADNHRALALYRSLGFRHEGTRTRFVRLPDGRYVDDMLFALLLRP